MLVFGATQHLLQTSPRATPDYIEKTTSDLRLGIAVALSRILCDHLKWSVSASEIRADLGSRLQKRLGGTPTVKGSNIKEGLLHPDSTEVATA